MLKNHRPVDSGLINDAISAIAVIDAIVDDIILDTIDIQSTVNDVESDVATVDALVDTIEAVTSALPTLTEVSGTVTTDGSEQNVYINLNPLGVYNPICVTINCTAQTAGETIVIRLYYDNAPGGAGWILADEVTYVGAISPEMIIVDLDPNRYGVLVTIEKTGGTNRAYPWDVLYEI